MISRGVLKLADFGLAVFLHGNELLHEKSGTPAFMAPEQHLLGTRSVGYGFPVDVWAAGCTMHMLICGGCHPFLGAGNVLDKQSLCRGTLNFGGSQFMRELTGDLFGASVKTGFSDGARSLCRQMLMADPMKRIDINEALKDPWLTQEKSLGDTAVDVAFKLGSVVEEAPEALSEPQLTDAAPMEAADFSSLSLSAEAQQQFLKLQLQLVAAERQIKAAEERETALLQELERRSEGPLIIPGSPIPVPECVTRCNSFETVCSTSGKRVGCEKIVTTNSRESYLV